VAHALLQPGPPAFSETYDEDGAEGEDLYALCSSLPIYCFRSQLPSRKKRFSCRRRLQAELPQFRLCLHLA
jgi:hypothetical protein